MGIDSLPKKYQPAWYRLNLEPLEVCGNMNINDIKKLAKKENPLSKGIKPTILQDDDDDELPIKSTAPLQPSKDSMWYEDFPEDADDIEIVDNNEVIDLEKVQIKAPQSIHNIREKLLQKKNVKQANKMTVPPGEYVLLYNNSAVEVGPLNKIKVAAEEIIIANEDLEENDLVIFLRVPLDKVFK